MPIVTKNQANQARPARRVSDNFVNGRRQKDPVRDAYFFPEFWAVRAGAIKVSADGTSVTTHTPTTPLLPAREKPVSHPSTPTETHDPIPPAFKRFLRQYAWPKESHPKAYRTPEAWNRTSDWMQGVYHLHVAHAHGPVHAFTIRLRDDVEALARSQPSAASWLLKRLSRELSSILPQPLHLAFRLENADQAFTSDRVSTGLHVHGIIVCPQDLIEDVRKAFRRAAGEWTKARQHQAHTRPDPDLGWMSYGAKDAPFTRRKSTRLPAYLRAVTGGFNGKPCACTQALNAAARQLYTGDRIEVLARLKS